MKPEQFLPPKEYAQTLGLDGESWTLPEAEAYTRWLATHHYENFHVVSFLLPRRLHQDFYNVYAFCRWSDDLGDEMGDRGLSLRLLVEWRALLARMDAGGGWSGHPVFVALRKTADQYTLPRSLFSDLITAFEQDQTVSRYEDWEALLGYCRNSANPVGRLVLRLCGYHDARLDELSDATCTALQLANFWQDVAVDLEKDRVYLPLDLLQRHGCTVEDLFAHRQTEGFRGAMREACEYARRLFEKGLELPRHVDRRLAVDLDLFSRGGLKVLEKIEAQNYAVLERRPVVTKSERVLLLVGSVGRVLLGRTA